MAIEKESKKHQDISDKIQRIESKIKQSESSFYGWLNKNYPNWENTIGKVIDDEHVLFHSSLNPQLADKELSTFFGVTLNLDTLTNRIKTVKEYRQEIEGYQKQLLAIQVNIEQLNENKEEALQKLKNKFNKQVKQLNDTIAENEYKLIQSEEGLKKNKVELDEWITKSKQEKETVSLQLESELDKISFEKQTAQDKLNSIKDGIKRKVSLKENQRNTEIQKAELTKNEKIDQLNTSISENQLTTESRISFLKKEKNSELSNQGANTKRLNEIDEQLTKIKTSLDYISNNEHLVFEYNKDKRELFDKVPQLKADRVSLEKKQEVLSKEFEADLAKIDTKHDKQERVVLAIKSKLEEFEHDMKVFDEFKKSLTFINIQSDIPDEVKTTEVNETASHIIDELNVKHYAGVENFNVLQQATNTFTGNFNENNLFKFEVKFNEDTEYLKFAASLKEFIEEDKINEYQKRVNERFADIINLIGRETTELSSKEAEIEKIIKKINDDFVSKNFVQAIKEMEMRTQKSSNPIVKLLLEIKEFNDENSFALGEPNLFSSVESESKNEKAVALLKRLVVELERTKNTRLTLSESFDLQFRIVENDNDSGWVEKLSNVGSEGTDVLVKAMINILLLNVFKDTASRKFKDFKLHCMMDEIGRLHPNNVKGILRFANERNILLINGSPTSQNATDYKYTYKLAKEQSMEDPKKYITKVNRLVKVNTKVLNS